MRNHNIDEKYHQIMPRVTRQAVKDCEHYYKMHNEIPDEAYHQLMARVTLQAVKDYEHFYKMHKRAFIKYARIKRKTYRTKEDRKALNGAKVALSISESGMKEVEDFFKSLWGEWITGIDGEKAVNTIRERARKLGLNYEDEPLENVIEAKHEGD